LRGVHDGGEKSPHPGPLPKGAREKNSTAPYTLPRGARKKKQRRAVPSSQRSEEGKQPGKARQEKQHRTIPSPQRSEEEKTAPDCPLSPVGRGLG